MKKYIKIISAGMAAIMVTGALSACATFLQLLGICQNRLTICHHNKW